MKRKLIIFLITAFVLACGPARAYAAEAFADVPEGHWAYDAVMKLRELNIVSGFGMNSFGPGQAITVAQFEAMLGRLTGQYLEGLEDDRYVTRGEMIEAVINAMGYESLALKMIGADQPFADAGGYQGYLALAYGFGLVSAPADGLYRPYENATRAQAAVVLANVYALNENNINFANGFYAIKSAGQMEFIDALDCVSFGWSRVEPGGVNMTSANANEYFVPEGYGAAYDYARRRGKKMMLMVAVQDILVQDALNGETPLVEHILSDGERGAYVEAVAGAVTNNSYSLSFDGVVIDFENLKGETLKQQFNAFLWELRAVLPDKEIYVAVHPARKAQEYYDAYDFKFIGGIADMVILMAHDYNAKKMTEREMETGFTITPLAPLDEVCYALHTITDPETGVADKKKIMLQISFDTAQWKLLDGKVINRDAYRPDYDTLARRMERGVSMRYSGQYESPYVEFYSEEDGATNILWYEDERSVEAKITLARMFGIESISLWRLGNIPAYDNEFLSLNVWERVKDALGRE